MSLEVKKVKSVTITSVRSKRSTVCDLIYCIACYVIRFIKIFRLKMKLIISLELSMNEICKAKLCGSKRRRSRFVCCPVSNKLCDNSKFSERKEDQTLLNYFTHVLSPRHEYRPTSRFKILGEQIRLLLYNNVCLPAFLKAYPQFSHIFFNEERIIYTLQLNSFIHNNHVQKYPAASP